MIRRPPRSTRTVTHLPDTTLVRSKPISIIDLSGIPSEVINVVVSVIARMTLDIALWSERQMPILLVCEEAHRYAPQNSDLGFEPAKSALWRIATEGRKEGLSRWVVTPRSQELAAGLDRTSVGWGEIVAVSVMEG